MADARIAVKFCGGCNPGYDRRAAYELIRDGVTADAGRRGDKVSFEQVEEGVLYDALLVICGCANRCASVSGIRSETPPVYVWTQSGAADAISSLAAAIVAI
ncbi:MAG: hypothetical protein LBJ91_06050 [Clostridiales Family XIII bacterium]|jgi:hypothetical protein|nr:hypothetical protein [Clostridiales Family XIII bacterium]